ncbi:MAG: hypothetical protein PHG05_00220 [Candidatus Nanoarchaeia archaeon]|nr:hypothetical protein [Candidatus Nanoarchaeia archaeon]
MREEIQKLKPRVKTLLLIIFILTLAFRLYFAYQTPYYSDSEAYLNIRNIEDIKSGDFSFTDDLSFSGRSLYALPVFHFIFAGLSFVIGDFAFKVIPEILASFLVILVFLISKRVCNDDRSSLFAAFSAGFMPLLFSTFFNNLSQSLFFIILILYMLYCFMRINESIYFNQFILLAFLLPLINLYYFAVIFLFVIYLLLARSESLKIARVKKEILVFSILLGFLMSFIIFKKPLLNLGLSVFWQNTPTTLLNSYFAEFSVIEVIFGLGLIPILFGIYGIYHGIAKKKDENIFLFSSFGLTLLILLILRLVRPDFGLVLFGISIIIFSSVGYSLFFEYLDITKFSSNFELIKKGLFILLFLSIVIPSLIAVNNTLDHTITDEEYNALLWLRSEADTGEILSSYEEGDYISSIAERKNLIDTNFLYAKNINKRFDELMEIYTTKSDVKAKTLADKYFVSYIYVTRRTKELYNLEEVEFTKDERCFRKAWSEGETAVYKTKKC